MTCIVGLIENKTVYLGGDSMISSGDAKWTLSEPKVFVSNNVGIGYAGTLRVYNILRYKLKIPKIRKNISKYVNMDLLDAIRRCFQKNGISIGGDADFQIIIGVAGRLFVIDDGFGVAEISEEFAIIGSGTDYASGSLYSTVGGKPSNRIITALKASEHFCASVGGPFYVLKVD